MEPERLWRKGFVKQMSFKSGVKGRGSDRWLWAKEMTVTRRYVYAQDEVNQEESEQNEVDRTNKGVDSTDKVMHI